MKILNKKKKKKKKKNETQRNATLTQFHSFTLYSRLNIEYIFIIVSPYESLFSQ